MGHNRPKFCVRYAKKYAGLKKYTTTSSGHRCKNKCFVLSKFDKSIIHFIWREEQPNKSATIFRCFLSFPRLWESGPQKTRHIFSQQQQLYDWVHPCVSVGEWTKTGGFSEKVSVGRCEVRQNLEKKSFTWKRHQAEHTAPDWCQPDKFATLSFSAFLVVCDRDKKPHVGQQIL